MITSVGRGRGKDGVGRRTGRIEVAHPTLGSPKTTLFYSERPEGAWNGKVHYFATFVRTPEFEPEVVADR